MKLGELRGKLQISLNAIPWEQVQFQVADLAYGILRLTLTTPLLNQLEPMQPMPPLPPPHELTTPAELPAPPMPTLDTTEKRSPHVSPATPPTPPEQRALEELAEPEPKEPKEPEKKRRKRDGTGEAGDGWFLLTNFGSIAIDMTRMAAFSMAGGVLSGPAAAKLGFTLACAKALWQAES
ncbi:unnamed protein product [Durusdinium trenchii]|uniref:Uncharacterized protein n=1 Tax=Durusdinium trenchii TaxID=1381693 RepID=A0ABP0J0R0_9DINO